MRIYVGGLPYSTNSDGLRDLFAQSGMVTEANVVEDRYSGQSRGFGFVEMADASDAGAAIKRFNGFQMDGRALTVNEAKPREDRNGSSNGTSRGNGGYGGGGDSRRW